MINYILGGLLLLALFLALRKTVKNLSSGSCGCGCSSSCASADHCHKAPCETDAAS